MAPTVPEIEGYLLATLQELARDWDFSRPIDGDTKLFAEFGFESLDVVVLGASIQDHYRRPMPFAELLAQIGRSGSDLTVGELVRFVRTNLLAVESVP